METTPRPDADVIGTLAWLRRTEGRLSLRERLHLMQQGLAPLPGQLWRGRWARPHAAAPGALAPLLQALPDTPAVGHALQAMADTGHTDVLQHSWRTHWWAQAWAIAEGHQVDTELLLVASLMHDLGMADAGGHAARGCSCFTAHGALAAMALVRQAQPEAWPDARAQRLGEAITLHMNGPVPGSQGLEAHLLQRGTACDVIGAELATLPRTYRDAVLARHPRGDFDGAFRRFLAAQHRDHPRSRAALMHQLGVGWLMHLAPR